MVVLIYICARNIWDLVDTHSLQHWELSDILIFANQMGVKFMSHSGLDLHFQFANEFEHLFKCILLLGMSVKVFLDPINIWVKQITLPDVSGHHQILWGLNNEKAE